MKRNHDSQTGAVGKLVIMFDNFCLLYCRAVHENQADVCKTCMLMLDADPKLPPSQMTPLKTTMIYS